MNKERFIVPDLDEQTTRIQIVKIVSEGVKTKQSFPSYLKSMLQQVGLRHIFSDRLEITFISFMVIILVGLIVMLPNYGRIQDIYSYTFLLSPILFLSLSIFTYISKTQNHTYEVEMACKYNVYQIIAFRMLVFSVFSIVLNTIAVAILAIQYEEIQFMRAFLLSITALFLFSILLLFALMKRRTTEIVVSTVIGWTIGNLVLQSANVQLYNDLLMKMPIFVNAVILIVIACMYLRCVKNLIHFKQTEGVFE
ncbi:hypothetical protein CSV79_16010 [Sporosarcina sp. P13]|uniref:hypothetical protein n=1 Tax=Sporosarcina sp. P13 TaxID=2048263 RepID=UPI000C169253|nr:hypothetical protein [Sporosarcina sp. P13]PIC62636.1 hypothetical protein CSV79_16010 [Sporosarcina sp. P13]